ncbi:MAG: TetR/AcrR family transcriptional regulator [Bacteroidetes Order II. Incertae sedis bacterium]|nr:TetR/AcrR family transcriptional regulator [Bacteroidetes Order II. bacterium]
MLRKITSSRDPVHKSGVERHREVITAAQTRIRNGTSPRDLTLHAVAAQAGVPRASLYYFFSSIKVTAAFHTQAQKVVLWYFESAIEQTQSNN